MSTSHNSTLAADSPVDLYWISRPVQTDEQIAKGDTDITICEAFWDDFLIAAKAVYHLDREATVYDAFEFIRAKLLGGWTMIEDSTFIKDIDEQIEREYKKEVRNGKWKTT